jgi:hypothetical protein
MEIYNGPASYAVGDGIPSRGVLTRGSDAHQPREDWDLSSRRQPASGF